MTEYISFPSRWHLKVKFLACWLSSKWCTPTLPSIDPTYSTASIVSVSTAQINWSRLQVNGLCLDRYNSWQDIMALFNPHNQFHLLVTGFSSRCRTSEDLQRKGNLEDGYFANYSIKQTWYRYFRKIDEHWILS